MIYKNKTKKKEYKNTLKAIEYYQKSVKLDNPLSMFNLAIIYENGEDIVEKDILKSIELYQKAADLSDTDAINSLGRIYQNGEEGIVEKDILKSIELYQKAADLGHSDSNSNLLLFIKTEKILLKKIF